MPKPPADATKRNERQHQRALTAKQLIALSAEFRGASVKEAATEAGVNPAQIFRWRGLDPVYQAERNRRRREAWGETTDRLPLMFAKVLDTLTAILDDQASPHRLTAAREVLRLVPLTKDDFRIGPTDPEAIVRNIVAARRNKAPDPLLDMTNQHKGLPDLEAHVEQVWAELDALAEAAPEESARD